jgi:hypothetical protein
MTAEVAKEERQRRKKAYKQTRFDMLARLRSFERLVHRSHEECIINLSYDDLNVLINELSKGRTVTDAYIDKLPAFVEVTPGVSDQ